MAFLFRSVGSSSLSRAYRCTWIITIVKEVRYVAKLLIVFWPYSSERGYFAIIMYCSCGPFVCCGCGQAGGGGSARMYYEFVRGHHCCCCCCRWHRLIVALYYAMIDIDSSHTYIINSMNNSPFFISSMVWMGDFVDGLFGWIITSGDIVWGFVFIHPSIALARRMISWLPFFPEW